jgi:hypothetical protein
MSPAKVSRRAAMDLRIRNLEADVRYADIRVAVGANQGRPTRFVKEYQEYRGKPNVETGEAIPADHYDVYLRLADHPRSRTVDGNHCLDGFTAWPALPAPGHRGRHLDDPGRHSQGQTYSTRDRLRGRHGVAYIHGCNTRKNVLPCLWETGFLDRRVRSIRGDHNFGFFL